MESAKVPSELSPSFLCLSDSSLKSSAEESWAPVWGSVEESPLHPMISIYLPTWKFETYDDQVDDSELPPIVMGGKEWRGRDKYDQLKKFLKQVRESRGYDVDYCPRMLGGGLGPFYPRPGERLKNNDKDGFKKVIAKINFVIEEVNALAEGHGKRYKYHDIERVVEILVSRCSLITFSVKEDAPNANAVKTIQAAVFTIGFPKFVLLEWRFKPQ